MNLGELLSRFPFPTGEPLIAVLDPLDVRVAVAWSRIPKRWQVPADPMPESEDSLWTWVWDGVSYDPAALAAASTLDEDSASDRLFALVASRLVRPDGTICPGLVRLAEFKENEKQRVVERSAVN